MQGTQGLVRPREEAFAGSSRQAQRLKALVAFCRQKPLGALGALVILGMALAALAAPLITTHDPMAINSDVRLSGPSSEHWFGTDNFGRDVFSRVVYGARVSLAVGLGAVFLAALIACLVGLVTGYVGGVVDIIAQRVVDAFMAFPTLVLLMAIVTVIGPSLISVTVILGVIFSFGQSRVVRSAVLAVSQEQYIEGAKVVGCSGLRILLMHVFPNVTAPLIVVLTTALGSAIIAEASLSFLGLGIPPSTPSWGQMLSGDSRQYMSSAPWMAIFPGLALSLAVFSFNMLGDAVRDVLDPRLRGSR